MNGPAAGPESDSHHVADRARSLILTGKPERGKTHGDAPRGARSAHSPGRPVRPELHLNLDEARIRLARLPSMQRMSWLD